jgi:transcriptional antiterminator Rof (Rho-off)
MLIRPARTRATVTGTLNFRCEIKGGERSASRASKSQGSKKQTCLILGVDQPSRDLLLDLGEQLAEPLKDDDVNLPTERRLALVEMLDNLLGEGEGGLVPVERLSGEDGDLANGNSDVVRRREGGEARSVGCSEEAFEVREDGGKLGDGLVTREDVGGRGRGGSDVVDGGFANRRGGSVRSRRSSDSSLDESASRSTIDGYTRWRERKRQYIVCGRPKTDRKNGRTSGDDRTDALSELRLAKLLVNLELLRLKSVGPNPKQIRKHVHIDRRLRSVPERLRGSL